MSESPFQGDTVALRPFEPDDASALAAYLNHPDLVGRRYIPWAFSETAPLSHQQVQVIIQKWGEAEKSLQLAVVHAESGNLIGHAESDWNWDPHSPSVSVVIAPAHQRKGFGSEAIRLQLSYLFEHTPAHVVSCWIADWNQAALEFAAYHGFQVAGRMRRAAMRQGRYYDVVVTDLLRSEWQQWGGGSHAS
jgi:RimJ/RimL family protein N-acetyltransferase